MKVVYPVIFTKTNDENDTYLIEIPDLKEHSSGLTEGFGLADAIHMARDYIGCSCFGLRDSDLPQPSKLEDININTGEFSEIGDSFVSLVDLDLTKYRRSMEQTSMIRSMTIPVSRRH